MFSTLNKYLTIRQYNTICKYWKIIRKYKSKIDNFDYSKYKNYKYLDDEEIITKCIEHNNNLNQCYRQLQGRLTYFKQEYIIYVNKIGYKFNDHSQNEHLFNLLNNGYILIYTIDVLIAKEKEITEKKKAAQKSLQEIRKEMYSKKMYLLEEGELLE